jgi:hypothetical protein
MEKPCPVCKQMFPESKLAEHLLSAHPEVGDPELQQMHQQSGDVCPICGARLPSHEALAQHNAQVHHL